MRKEQQIVVRLETAIVAEIDREVAAARRRWGLGIKTGFRYRPTRSSVVRRMIVEYLENRARASQIQRTLDV